MLQCEEKWGTRALKFNYGSIMLTFERKFADDSIMDSFGAKIDSVPSMTNEVFKKTIGQQQYL